MAVTINVDLQNRQVESWGGDLNSGSIKIYTGAQPAPNTAPTGTLLVTCALAADAYGPAVLGMETANPTISGVAVAAGTAGYAQQVNAAGTRWMYGSVTATGLGGDVQLNDITISISDTVTISASTLTQPSS